MQIARSAGRAARTEYGGRLHRLTVKSVGFFVIPFYNNNNRLTVSQSVNNGPNLWAMSVKPDSPTVNPVDLLLKSMGRPRGHQSPRRINGILQIHFCLGWSTQVG